MSDNKQLLKQAKEGFDTLDISEEYKNTALKHLEYWLTDEMFKEYVPQIVHMIEDEWKPTLPGYSEKGKWEFLLDSFYQVIPFGTAGRRGLVGIGPNRINLWTIQASAQGHSQYLIRTYGEEAQKRGIVLTYDVREYRHKGIYKAGLKNPVMNLNCKQLAEGAAQVYTANGIKVYMFEGVRSTPELSFTIRHLKAIAGAMFSASHNPPTDNGKKVYDESGGQLIPPYDQILVDEVETNVKKIDMIDLDKAKKQGLLQFVGKDVDEAYWKIATAASFSQERGVKILYTPLHGTGMTSLYPALKKSDFNITPNPKTANFSGAFENVTYNIPNPEVQECFDSALPFADDIGADIILTSDPDADRIGIMVKRQNSWVFLNGHELGTILVQYGISQHQANHLLQEESTVIKTHVTTSLIQKIAKENHVHCIADLLVGFKYIAHEMNALEQVKKIQCFILGTEESHGFIIGNYCRDKDSTGAAVWLSELAAQLKKEQKTLVDYLDEIYAQYGYCDNDLSEIIMVGATGMDKIADIMAHLRALKDKFSSDKLSFDEFRVNAIVDRWDGESHVSLTDTMSRNMLTFHFDELPETQKIRVTVRPSGTEPKIKIYVEVFGHPAGLRKLPEEKEHMKRIREKLKRVFMFDCYETIGVKYPERGFLLFWQIPLSDQLHYFKIEPEIAELKNLPDKAARKEGLERLLGFLGMDPIKKVDRAFKAKYDVGMLEYLNL